MKPKPNQYERYRNAIKGERLPLALVDLENFDRNVEYVASTQSHTGKTIRLHTKSIRSVPMLERIFEKGGSLFKGVMTFTMEETAFLAEKGFDDFIVAYPTVQASDLDIFVRLTKQGKKVSLMVDSKEHIRLLSRAGAKARVELKACLDVDMSYRPGRSSIHLGVRRSPVRTVADAMAVAMESKSLKGVAVNAIMGYEAHIAGPNDAVPGAWLKNQLTAALKKASIHEFTPRRVDIVAELRSAGIDIRIVNGGGSGSLASTGADPSVTEVTAGSAFYAPALFWHYRDVSFLPAAFFALQVVRNPAPGIITCLGGGYVAAGSAGKDKLPVPVYPEGMTLLPLEGAGEVQTPLLLAEGCPAPSLGDPVFFQHAKAGELAERFNELFLISGDRISGRAKTYRGEGKAFL